MKEYYHVSEIIFFSCSVQAFLMAFLLFLKKKNTITEQLIGILNIILGTTILYKLIPAIHVSGSNIVVLCLPFLLPPILYLFTVKIIRNEPIALKRVVKHAALFGLVIMFWFILKIKYQSLGEFITLRIDAQFNNLNVNHSPIMLLVLLHFVQSITYARVSLIKYKLNEQELKSYYSNIDRKQLKGIRVLWIVLLGLPLFASINFLLGKHLHLDISPPFFNHVYLTLFIFILSIRTLSFEAFTEPIHLRMNTTPVQQQLVAESNSKYQTSGLTLKDIELKVQVIRDAVESNRLYLDQEFNIDKLSGIVEIPKHNISEVLNKGLNKNFYLFINEYRISLSKQLLLDSRYSIEGVGYECGFNSKSTFNRTFKKLVGQTPSEFKNACNNLKSSPH